LFFKLYRHIDMKMYVFKLYRHISLKRYAFKLYRYIGMKECYFIYKYQFDDSQKLIRNNLLLPNFSLQTLYLCLLKTKQNFLINLLKLLFISLTLYCILKIYCFNPPSNIMSIINTLKITIFILQTLVAIPTNIIVSS
jgi:hypothetical protein